MGIDGVDSLLTFYRCKNIIWKEEKKYCHNREWISEGKKNVSTILESMVTPPDMSR